MMTGRVAVVFAVLGAAGLGCEGLHFFPTPGDSASCTPSKMVMLGDLDGRSFDVAVRLDSSNFQQAALPYRYQATFGTGMVQLTFNDVISSNAGANTGAVTTGTITMPAGTPHAGETICVGGRSSRPGFLRADPARSTTTNSR